jgi:L-ascorbate metabolism protein UlaG (beta-lactamase superfamily)
MVINYLGGGSFKLQSGETSMLINPENNRYKADVVLKTLAPAEFSLHGVDAPGQKEIFFPGEYEVKEIEIKGIPVPDESNEKFSKTVYAVTWEDITFALLGHLSKFPSLDIIERLGEPDVLILPVGGGHFLEAKLAAKLTRQLEPAFVIPTFYKTPAEFAKEMGQKADSQEKLVFKKKDAVKGKTQLIVLETKT